MEVSLQASWSREKQGFGQNKKCKNLTKRPENFFEVKVTILDNIEQSCEASFFQKCEKIVLWSKKMEDFL